jgi:hypothetical protein
MFCYLWYETTDVNLCKFGEHWVHPNIDPNSDISNYIRQSMSRRKDKFDDGIVQIKCIWDVSDIAKKENRFKQHGKIDDFLRNKIGYVKQSEVHLLSADDMKIRVENLLSKLNSPKPIVNLSTAQYETLSKLINSYKSGNRKILAELAARFGKTITSSALSVETNQNLTIICSYVKTVFTSFQNDINSFEQFKHIVHINADDTDYETKVLTALKNNKKVFVYLSLCNGSKRDNRIEFLFGINTKRCIIIDEADFGAHKETQTTPLKKNIKDDDLLLIMTGTNSDRAVSNWDVDDMVSVTYGELLVHKNLAEVFLKKGQDKISNPNKLKNFSKDLERDTLYAGIAGYQLDLRTSVEQSIKMGLVSNDMKELPSWSKFVAHPLKSKGWFTQVLQAMFKGQHNLKGLDVDYHLYQSGNYTNNRRVAMMFFPDNTQTNDKHPALSYISDICKNALSEWEIVDLSGNTTTQAKAEKKVKEVMELNPTKNILIISAKMAQRSFSISKIDELYLCYDKGQNGATIQKMSRALTPDGVDKIGKIFSLSFDSNRDDKFDSLILTTALNRLNGNKTETDIKEELKRVLNSIDIFSCMDSETILIEPDSFINEALNRKSISRVMGSATNLIGMSDDEITALANGNRDYIKNIRKDSAPMGKTKETKEKQSSGIKSKTPQQLKDWNKVREMLTTIYEHSDILIRSARPFGAKTIADAFKVFESKKWQGIITSEFGVNYDIIKHLFMTGRINENWVNILHS